MKGDVYAAQLGDRLDIGVDPNQPFDVTGDTAEIVGVDRPTSAVSEPVFLSGRDRQSLPDDLVRVSERPTPCSAVVVSGSAQLLDRPVGFGPVHREDTLGNGGQIVRPHNRRSHVLVSAVAAFPGRLEHDSEAGGRILAGRGGGAGRARTCDRRIMSPLL